MSSRCNSIRHGLKQTLKILIEDLIRPGQLDSMHFIRCFSTECLPIVLFRHRQLEPLQSWLGHSLSLTFSSTHHGPSSSTLPQEGYFLFPMREHWIPEFDIRVRSDRTNALQTLLWVCTGLNIKIGSPLCTMSSGRFNREKPRATATR